VPVTAKLAELLARLVEDPFLQGLVAALATFVLEDPVTVGCGLLVADQKMAFATALIGVSLGIAVGDVGLYGIGRLTGPVVGRWRLVSQQRLDRASSWFKRNLVSAVLLSRFVPGMRLPTYVAAGVLKAPLWRFTALAVGASLVWTFLLLRLTVAAGETVWPMLGRMRWPVAAVLVVLLVVMQRRAARRLDSESQKDQVLSRFELWSPWLFYIPVVLYTGWLAIRYRGLMLPTVANPSIYSGGLIGESKSQILDLVPPEQRHWIAAYSVLERPPNATPEELLAAARRVMAEDGLVLPVVAKPDMGQRGAGVQPIRTDQELSAYLEGFPPGQKLLLQEMAGIDSRPGDRLTQVPERLRQAREAGVLYLRLPGTEEGAIFSLTMKLFPEVVGDGIHTLAELIDADPRAHRIREIYLLRHHDQQDRVLADGERLRLVFAGNHCQGAIFRNGAAIITDRLRQRIDEICRTIPGFYFGRLDILFDDLGLLLDGEDFKIVEINGAGAEATHIWDASVSVGEAYQTLFHQYRMLFAIGAANRRRGHRPLRLVQLLRDIVEYRRLSRLYPLTR
jgi:membrane protein DedA with SNARE-associated domain